MCEDSHSCDQSTDNYSEKPTKKLSQSKKNKRQIKKDRKKYQNDQSDSSDTSNFQDKQTDTFTDYSLKLTKNPINKASITNYNLLKTIGRGLYSKVKLAASNSHSNQFYAIKIIKRHHVEKVSL